jgi:N,N'-diacetyllegionaminate synthase
MNAARFDIGSRAVGSGAPVFVIAEVAQNHDGSLGLAHAFIDAGAEAGADAVKFQTHIADAESTRDEPFRVQFSRQDASRYDYWKRMEFTAEQWSGLAAHAKDVGIEFLSSAFSLVAVELLRGVGMAAWKVGSGEAGSVELLTAMAATGYPVLLSSGMSSIQETDDAVATVRSAGAPVAVLQATSRYPSALADVGLNVVDEFRVRYGCPVGLSDHTGTVFPALAAIARGADLVEVHFALDRLMFGPDVAVSLTPGDLRTVTEMRDAVVAMESSAVQKDAMAAEMHEMREVFQKSVAPARAIAAGTALTEDMLNLKKPGTGLRADRLPGLIGRTLARDVVPDRLLREEDLE